MITPKNKARVKELNNKPLSEWTRTDYVDMHLLMWKTIKNDINLKEFISLKNHSLVSLKKYALNKLGFRYIEELKSESLCFCCAYVNQLEKQDKATSGSCSKDCFVIWDCKQNVCFGNTVYRELDDMLEVESDISTYDKFEKELLYREVKVMAGKIAKLHIKQ